MAALIMFALVAFRQPSMQTMGLLLLAAGVFTLVVISRAYTVRLQDRIIRLEMQGRLARLGRDRDFSRLSTPQIIALRFASDAELSTLCDRAVAENLSADQIKKGISNWQPDPYRT
jgi:hypothetical protein